MKEWTKEERYRQFNNKNEISNLYDKIQNSKYRQVFHIQPVTGLLNDPNGFVYHNKTWHLFYQWFPFGAVHGLKHWYHVTSTNLITWKNKGVCIYPDCIYDNKGAYSGSALVTDQSIYLYYTGNHRDENWHRHSYTCLVNLRDDGTVHKYSKPLFGPHPSYNEHQRDPKIIYRQEDQTYYLLIGAQTLNKKGCVIIYKSSHHNKDFSFAGELKVPGFEDFGDMWECPSIETIDNQDILIFCPQHIYLENREQEYNHNGYLLGKMDWKNLIFTPSGHFHVLDFGFDSYAAECAANINDSKKAILIAWMGLPDSSYPSDNDCWQGCLTMPRELRIENRRLLQKPLEGFKILRDQRIDTTTHKLPQACEIEIHCQGNLNLLLFSKKDQTGGLRIQYTHHTLTVDRSRLHNHFNKERGEIRSRVLENDLYHLRIFIDTSSIEIYVNDGESLFTSRVFLEEDEHYIYYQYQGNIQIWSLKPAVFNEFIA